MYLQPSTRQYQIVSKIVVPINTPITTYECILLHKIAKYWIHLILANLMKVQWLCVVVKLHFLMYQWDQSSYQLYWSWRLFIYSKYWSNFLLCGFSFPFWRLLWNGNLLLFFFNQISLNLPWACRRSLIFLYMAGVLWRWSGIHRFLFCMSVGRCCL